MYTYKSTILNIIKKSLNDTITGRQDVGRILNYDNFSNTVLFYYFRLYFLFILIL